MRPETGEPLQAFRAVTALNRLAEVRV
jgi:hypothetical protein